MRPAMVRRAWVASSVSMVTSCRSAAWRRLVLPDANTSANSRTFVSLGRPVAPTKRIAGAALHAGSRKSGSIERLSQFNSRMDAQALRTCVSSSRRDSSISAVMNASSRQRPMTRDAPARRAGIVSARSV